jgi:hypothetical protein
VLSSAGFRPRSSLVGLLVVAVALSLFGPVRADAQVVITEIAPAPPYRLLNPSTDPPRLGVGPVWTEPAFDDQAWSSGQGPFGFGYSNLVTDLTAAMSGRTPSVYLRCIFSVSPAQLAGDFPLRCLLNYDDGFVASLNGHEFARANLGPAGLFIPARHPAFNARTSAEPVMLELGSVSRYLRPGPNLLTIQVHNTWPWTDVLPHDPTLLADARLILGDAPEVELVGNHSVWRWFAGTTEPSGGFRDPAILRSAEAIGEFHDWIELHNRGDRDVDLQGWSLSDDVATPRKWIFPRQRLEPGAYLVVFCSGLDRRSPDSGFLHTNFRLRREGEALTLRQPDGTLASGFLPAYPALDAFHSYGVDEASGAWGFLAEPSPGRANPRTQLLGRTAPVTLLPKAGFYSTDITVEFQCPTPFTRLRYTLDGSEPTPTHGLDYAGPLVVSTSTTVRARAFRTGWVPSETATATYLIRAPENLAAMPALVLSGDPGRTFFGPEGLTTVAGGTYVGAFQEEVWTAGSTDDYNMYLVSGPAAERPSTVEWLKPGSDPAGPWNCGLRVSSSVWSTPRMITPPGGDIIWNHDGLSFRIKPSFGLFFRGEYGLDELDFPLFDGPGGTRFDDLRLRAGKNDWANPFIRDELVRRLFGQMGQISSRGVLVNLFVNGQFKSYYNLVERLRGNFFRAQSGGTADWDIIGPNETAEGDDQRWKEDRAFLVGGSLADDQRYREATRRFDVVNLADYALLNLFCATADWPENNWVLARERSSGGRWRFHVWDAEVTFGYMSPKTVTFDTLSMDLLSTNTPPTVVAEVFTAFHQNPEFRLLFADRAQQHLLGSGTLTESNVLSVADQLHRQAAPSIQFVRREELKTGYLTFWAANRLPALLPALAKQGLWPSVAAPHILLPTNLAGATAEILLRAGHTNDSLYYTVDGTDPRAPGGAIAGTALPDTGSVSVQGTTTLQARAFRAGEWSPLATAEYRPTPPEHLEITEIHYDPLGSGSLDGRLFEFVEIRNAGTNTASLAGVAFTEGIQFSFPATASLAPGAFAILVADAAAFTTRYPDVPVAGVFTGRLDNAGEQLTLAYRNAYPLVRLAYNNKAPWPTPAAGLGFSLVPSGLLDTVPSDPRHWRASSLPGGSPGTFDPTPQNLTVLVHEVSSRPSPGQPWWIEFHNPSPRAVDISHWWLSDDPEQPRKYAFPEGTILPIDGFLVVDATEMAVLPPERQVRLSPAGGQLILNSADSNDRWLGASAEFSYEAVPEGHSYGRTIDDAGLEFLAPLAAPTPDHPNNNALASRAVIQEIRWAQNPTEFDFVEIANRTTDPLPLHDPANPLRPWRLDGLDFDFPPGFVLAPGEIIVLCAADPKVFRAQHELPTGVRLLGPWAGQLDPTGETLRLQRPDRLPTGELVLLNEDRVRFRTAPPWPAIEVAGHSLQRRDSSGLGDSPSQWIAAPATPGQRNLPASTTQTALRLATPAAAGWVTTGDALLVAVAANASSTSNSAPTLTLYANDQLIGTTQGTSAEFSWTPAVSQRGPLQLRAVASTDEGTELTEATLPVRVLESRRDTVALIPTNAVWKVLRSALMLAPAWTGLAFDDSPWNDLTAPASEQRAFASDTFTYRRHALVLTDPLAAETYQLRVNGPPGSLVFLNGHELVGLPPDANSSFEFTLDAAWLRPGTNLFAAVQPPSPDSGSAAPFLLELTGQQTVTEPWIVESPVDLQVPNGSPASFAVRVAGSPVDLRWHHSTPGGETRSLSSTSPILTLPAASAEDVGTYFLVAANSLGSVTSQVAQLTLLPPDADLDGMPDSWEQQHGLNPGDPDDAQADADGDHASNLEEYYLATDPNRAPGQTAVVISEIMYRPASASPALEFVELLNPGPSAADLSGWQFTRGIRFAFSNLVLEPGASIAVAADPAAFSTMYPAVTHVLGPWIGTLSNSGETLELVDATGNTIDQVAYSPEGDWAQRRRGPIDAGSRGWEWFAEHDGLGKSLELIQPGLSNHSGQNWAASRVAGGTPGATNSVAQTNAAPLIDFVTHLPVNPTPTSIVRVLATISDEVPGTVEARLYYRIHQQIPPPPFVTVSLADDGLHGDGLAGDGLWAGDIPPQPAGAVVEYYVAATDDAGSLRHWPAPALDETLAPVQSDNALYLVDTTLDARPRPRFRLVMTETERVGLESADRRSNAAFNAAVIIEDGVNTTLRQRVSLRIRGASTRFAAVPNLRLHFPSDQPWQGVEDVNLNTYEWAPSQIVGGVLALNAGVPAAHARPVDVFLNATNRAIQGAHVQLQVVDGAWANDLFPNDPQGNVYTARRPNTDLAYLGTNAALYAAYGYSKESNREAND